MGGTPFAAGRQILVGGQLLLRLGRGPAMVGLMPELEDVFFQRVDLSFDGIVSLPSRVQFVVGGMHGTCGTE